MTRRRRHVTLGEWVGTALVTVGAVVLGWISVATFSEGLWDVGLLTGFFGVLAAICVAGMVRENLRG